MGGGVFESEITFASALGMAAFKGMPDFLFPPQTFRPTRGQFIFQPRNQRIAMHKLLFGAACACFMVGCNKAPEVPARSAAPPPLLSGIDVQYIDDSVRPQDDFYKHINGKWLASTEIPADKASYGSFTKLRDDSEAQLRAIIEGLPSPAAAKGADQQKIAELYASFMDEEALEGLGMRPLDAEFAKIDALKDRQGIAGLIAHFNQIGVSRALHAGRASGRQGFDQVCVRFGPGRSRDARSRLLSGARRQDGGCRKQYGQYIEKMLALAGDKTAAARMPRTSWGWRLIWPRCSGRRLKTVIR